MTRDEYKTVLLSKGFVHEGTQMGYPGRGEEDKYTLAGYDNQFYITRIRKEDELSYGFVTGKVNGKRLDNIYRHNAIDTFAEDKGLYVWVDEAFMELAERL